MRLDFFTPLNGTEIDTSRVAATKAAGGPGAIVWLASSADAGADVAATASAAIVGPMRVLRSARGDLPEERIEIGVRACGRSTPATLARD